MLELIDICYSIDGKKILDNVNLKINENKLVVITGPNGSGKSTLAKIIAGIIKPTSGKIIFDSMDITDFSLTKKSKYGISYAFQNPVKFKGLTVYNILNIASGFSLDKNTAVDALIEVGLGESYLDRELSSSLSGGEAKRVEIAAINLRNSLLTIFDEPEAGIDLWSFNSLVKLFKKIENKTTIVISHQEKIINIADEIVLLKNGVVSSVGQLSEILDKEGDLL